MLPWLVVAGFCALGEECAQCIAENRRLTGRIQLLLARVDQLEAALGTQRAEGRGVRAISELTMFRMGRVAC
jgi:hypothetical protein